MKFNWGWGIAIFMACFVTFILYFVVYSFGNKVDLEYEDYYPRELVHQEIIDATENALPFAEEVKVKNTGSNILVTFPGNFDKQIREGTIVFFRPSDKDLDKEFKFSLDEKKSQSFENSNFKSGFYNVILEFKDNEKSYYLKKGIYL